MRKQSNFQPTVEDCERARQFLIDHGRKWLVDDTLRTDGYTIIHMANELLNDIEAYRASGETNE